MWQNTELTPKGDDVKLIARWKHAPDMIGTPTPPLLTGHPKPGTEYDPIVHRYTPLDWVYHVSIRHIDNGAELWFILMNVGKYRFMPTFPIIAHSLDGYRHYLLLVLSLNNSTSVFTFHKASNFCLFCYDTRNNL